jgi:arylsulfatase A
MRPGQVNAELVDSTDFLPTLCEAAGARLPSSLAIDGRSFLPQLLGQRANPRKWIYCWYAKNGGPTAKAEFAMTRALKLYRDGRAFDLTKDPFEERPLADLPVAHVDTARMLRTVLDRFAGARPEHLLASTSMKTAKRKNNKSTRSGNRKRVRQRAR